MTTILSRRILLSALPVLAAPSIVRAADFPTRPLRAIVPFPPGGGVDVFARPFAQALAAVLGQSVVIENQGGASSRLGSAGVGRATPDGHTLLITNDTLAAVEALPVAGGSPILPTLAPVLLAVGSPQLLLTHPRSGIPHIAAYAERVQNPARRPNTAVPGLGTAHHFVSALFNQAVGGRVEHVPYRGGGPVVADLLAGTVDAAVLTLGAAVEHIRDGRLVGLAVTSPTRAVALPDVPTVAETVAPGFEILTWMGVLAPAATPAPVVSRLQAAGLAALEDLTLRARLGALGFDPIGGGPERFGTLLRDTVARFAAVAPLASIRAEEGA
ncbi:Bug family tripartite tricarboxylate transporter substrate binding protein [Muricoccus radiodurans]|uniref:Bug family tripartite tricarboxylate transporter substrate binding protein n=1 Tax=Muricoccus radiodurans TaxID=2231721 RepID=UPI003CE8DE41